MTTPVPSPSGYRSRAHRRARRRQAIIGAAVAGLLAATAVVVVTAVSSGSRAGTLVGATGIDTFNPKSGLTNAEVYITGAGFTNAQDVKFNGVSVTSFNVVDDTQIVTLVPAGATTGPITVVTPDGPLVSSDSFSPSAPIISGFSPTSAGAGTSVTVTGANLSGVNRVRIGGREAVPASVSDSTLTVTVPQNAVTGRISVFNGQTAIDSPTDLTITSPAITDLNPAFLSSNRVITITGRNLGGLSAVSFNGAAGTVLTVAADGTSATVRAPTIVSAGLLRITAGGGSTQSDAPMLLFPTLNASSLPTAALGSVLTLNGTNLSSVTAVGFPGLAPTSNGVTVVSDTQIKVVVPMEATSTGQLTLVGNGTWTGGSYFVPKAAITSMWPDTAPVGTQVVFRGALLNGITGVKFNGTPSYVFTTGLPNEFRVTVPPGATSGPVTFQVGTAGTIKYYTFTSPFQFTVGPLASSPAPAPPPAGSIPFTPAPDAPVGGTDFSRSPSVTLAGMVISQGTPSGGTTSTTVSSATTSPSTTTVAPTTTIATTSSTAASTTTGPTTATAPPTTGAPQPPYSGTATVQFGKSSKVAAQVTYQDPSTWSVTVSTPATITVPVGTTTMSVTGFSGSVQAANGSILWSFTGTAASTSLITSKFTFNAGAAVKIVGSCPMKSEKLCNGVGPWLSVSSDAGSTGFAAVVGNIVPNQSGLAYLAGANLTTQVLNVEASYPVDNPVTVVNGRLRIAYKDDQFAFVDDDVTLDSGSVNNGLDIVFTGKSRVDVPYLGSFNPPSLTVRYVDGGSLAVFDFPIKRVLHEASLGSAAFLTGHGAALNARVKGEPASLPDGVWVFLGSMRMPTYMRESFKTEDEGEVSVIATMETNGTTEIKALFETPMKIPEFAGIKTTFESWSFAVRFNESNPALKAEVAIGASGTIEFPLAKPMGVLLEASLAVTDDGIEFAISLTGSGFDGRAAWPNVLGVDGFDLDRFSIQLGWTKTSLSAGLAGAGRLPGKLLEYLGAPDGIDQPINFVLNLSEATPCLQIEVGTPGNTSPIIELPKGTDAVKVRYLKMSVSPFGCSVGIFSVPAGVVIAQKATLFGIKQDVYAAFNPRPTGLPGMPKTPSFFGWVNDKGTTENGAIKVSLKIKWGGGGSNPLPYFFIDGTLKLGSNNEIEIHGGCSLLSGCYAKGKGAIDLGIGVKTDLDLSVEGMGTPLMSVRGKGDLNLFGLKFGLEGSFNSASGAPLGFDFAATVDLPGKSALVDKLGIRLGFGLRATPEGCSGASCTGWTTNPLFALTIEGNTGGLMKVINGAADAFGAPPVADGGRYKLRAKWSPDLANIHFGGSSSVDLGPLGTVGASLDFSFCLDPSCFGNIDLEMAFDYRTHGKTFTFKIPIEADWSFNYTGKYSSSFSASGQVGDSWGGLKGTISGSFSIGLAISSPPLSVKVPLTLNLTASGYLGSFGTWSYVGSLDVTESSGKFCVRYDTGVKVYRFCV